MPETGSGIVQKIKNLFMRGCVFWGDEALRVERTAETLRETEARRLGGRSSASGRTPVSCHGGKRVDHFKLRHRFD